MVERLVKQLNNPSHCFPNADGSYKSIATLCLEAASLLTTLQAENVRLREERDEALRRRDAAIAGCDAEGAAHWACRDKLTTLQQRLDTVEKALKEAHSRLDWLSTWPGPDGSEPAKAMADYARKAAESVRAALQQSVDAQALQGANP